MATMACFLRAALSLGAAVSLSPQEIQSEMAATPEPPDFPQHFKPLAALGRRLQAAVPCTGVHGCGAAFHHMGTEVDSRYIYDLEPGYQAYLQRHLLDMGRSPQNIVLNLGKVCGDLLRMPLSRLRPPLDILVAGPPCPPLAGQGLKKSTADDRAKVFIRLLQWTIYATEACGLLAVILENVLGITYRSGGREPVIFCWLKVLRDACPEFEWGVDTLKLRDYLSPQTRVRVFLKDFRRCVAFMPSALPAFGTAHIRSVLGRFPPTRKRLGEQQLSNLEHYEQQIKDMHATGDLVDSDVVVIAVDRAPGLTYKMQLVKNVIPTLTTNSGSLMVLSVGDVVRDVPDEDREFMRHIRNSEKLCAQGFSPRVYLDLDSARAQKAAGNAYPPALIIAEVHPFVDALAKFDLAARPPASIIASEAEACAIAAQVTKLLGKPCKAVKAKKAKPSAAKLKKLKRKRNNRRQCAY